MVLHKGCGIAFPKGGRRHHLCDSAQSRQPPGENASHTAVTHFRQPGKLPVLQARVVRVMFPTATKTMRSCRVEGLKICFIFGALPRFSCELMATYGNMASCNGCFVWHGCIHVKLTHIRSRGVRSGDLCYHRLTLPPPRAPRKVHPCFTQPTLT